MAPPRLKIPGESTTKPSFASPQIQTAPDVGMSQKVAGIAPPLNNSATGPAAATPGVPKEPTPLPVPQGGQPKPKTGPGNLPQLGEQGQPTPDNPNAPGFAPAGGTPTVPTVTGAPPGVPNTSALASASGVGTPAAAPLSGAATPGLPAATTPEPVLPPPKALEGKNAAENEYIQAQNENAKKLYEAALAYNGGPNSELDANTRAAVENKRGATNARGAAGTIESSLFQGDLGRISTRLATANSASYLKYQKAITEANDALQKAQTAYQRAGEQERKEIAEAKERREATEAMVRASQPQPGPGPTPMTVAPNPLPTPDAYGWVHTPTGSYRVGGRR